MWGAIIPAVASLAGSFFGSKSTKDANEQNIENQREFAQHGIRWKVEDAKAAGLHPLYALGGGGATFTPSSQPVFDGQSLGQNLSRAASAFLSSGEKELKAAQLEAVKAGTAKDYALAAAATAEAARARQQAPVSIAPEDVQWFESKGMPVPGRAESFPIEQARIQELPLAPVPPSYLVSSKGAPAFKIWNVPGIGEFIAPDASNFAEAVESLENTTLQAAVLSANAAHYGPAGVERVKRAMGVKSDRATFGPWWEDPVGEAYRRGSRWLDSQRR